MLIAIAIAEEILGCLHRIAKLCQSIFGRQIALYSPVGRLSPSLLLKGQSQYSRRESQHFNLYLHKLNSV